MLRKITADRIAVVLFWLSTTVVFIGAHAPKFFGCASRPLVNSLAGDGLPACTDAAGLIVPLAAVMWGATFILFIPRYIQNAREQRGHR